MKRGELWWAVLPAPTRSGPGSRRPVLIVQSDPFNVSRISTVVVAVITSYQELAEAPGNVRLGRSESGLPRPSVVNVSQLLTIDRQILSRRIRALPAPSMSAVDSGLRLVLGL